MGLAYTDQLQHRSQLIDVTANTHAGKIAASQSNQSRDSGGGRRHMITVYSEGLKGATIRYLGRGGGAVFAWSFLFISQGRLTALFFSTQDRMEIFISIFILYLCQPPLWIKYLFPPCLVAIYLFHPFSPQKYLFPNSCSLSIPMMTP